MWALAAPLIGCFVLVEQGRVVPAPGPHRLDCLQVQRAGGAFAGLADVIAKALPNRWCDVLVPLDRALLERKVVAARFLLDFAVTLGGVKRLDRSEIPHGEFLGARRPDWRFAD